MDAPTAQAILDKLDVLTRKVDALDERLDGLERRVDALPDGLSWTLDALDRKITVVSAHRSPRTPPLLTRARLRIRNAPRRSMNIYAYHDTCQLAPMLSVLTGEPMDGFPETPAHLDRLEGEKNARPWTDWPMLTCLRARRGPSLDAPRPP
ncbi:hypothetical protein OCS_05952 [Ophiocordyceps sinensis CO18]|uniref:Uncharacterized protein n=1 Tax=Ophiocordyceps sinensis (strain Co18 / CGMCC 3.14243) TaxID=911162 RepID=T5A7E0_OPHSC|nr:hypothetical protein OCS_05952 [Ophiocordyceps sinensis CO18]